MSPAAPARPACLSLIAAVASNGVIGDGNALPWHLPEDLRHFRSVTAGHAVIMGRRTWDSLPPRFRPLPGRRNIVLTRDPQWQAAGAERAGTMAEALALVSGEARAFVIGGAELYAAALPWADELVLTEIASDFAGDARFPDWDRGLFIEQQRQSQTSTTADALRFDFVTYRRRPAPASR